MHAKAALRTTMVNQTILPRVKLPKNPNRNFDNKYHIGAEKRINGLRMIEAESKKLGLDTDSARIKITGRNKGNLGGTDSAANSSIKRYEIVWEGLLDFAVANKDWKSGIILHRNACPANPPPVNQDLSIHYMRFRTYEKGTLLRNHKTDEPFLLDGSPVRCCGDWRGVSSVGIFRSALSKLHSHYATTKGDYVERCTECMKIPLEDARKGEGCRMHPGRPNYWSRGCPSNSEEFKTKMNQLTNYVENTYEMRSTIAFLPGELRDIRHHLLSHNDLKHLMLWVIVMTGVKLFLRIDEVLELGYEQFLKEYFVVKDFDVESLLTEIQGKRDDHILHFAIWDDKDCPEFSASRAILLWVALTGIKGGFLFPSLGQLYKKAETPTEHYGYNSILEDFKYLCVSVLKKDMTSQSMKNMILGTHMLRKTAFLMAYWSHRNRSDWNGKLNPLDDASILLDARHKNVTSTVTYLSDSGALKSLLDRVDPHSVHQRVGRYDPIYVKTLDNFSALNQVEGNPSHRLNVKTLSSLADWYVASCLRIDIANFRRFSISQIFNIACAYKPDLTIQQEFEEGLKERLRPEDHDWAIERMECCFNERTKGLINHIQSTTAQTTSEVGGGLQEKKKPSERSVTKNDVVLTKNYIQEVTVATSKIDKVTLLVAGAAEVRKRVQEGKILVDPLRSWAYRAGKVAECVEKCHGGDVGNFLHETPKFRVGKWACCKAVQHKACFDRAKF